MSFPASDYETIFTTTEAHVISQLEDLMRDHNVDYRVFGSRNAASIDQGQVTVRIHLQAIRDQVGRARELVEAFFTPLDPDAPDLPEELRAETA